MKTFEPINKGYNHVFKKNQLAVSDDYKGITGKYFDNDKGAFGEAHADAYDEGKVEELMRVTDMVL